MSISQEFERQIHQRLLSRDPVAPADLAEAYLELLTGRLYDSFSAVEDKTLIYDAVVDAVLNYAEHPSRFDPAKSGLLSYLTMSARGDLLNALAKEGRRLGREFLTNDVEQTSVGRNKLIEDNEMGASKEISDFSFLVGQDLKKRALEVITEPRDREILQLILDGERKTDAYAKVLGVQDLDVAEQRKIVKRNKDRLNKRLQRLGVKLREQASG